jgi:hypothetical protein
MTAANFLCPVQGNFRRWNYARNFPIEKRNGPPWATSTLVLNRLTTLLVLNTLSAS